MYMWNGLRPKLEGPHSTLMEIVTTSGLARFEPGPYVLVLIH